MKIVMSVVALLILGVAAPHLAWQHSLLANLQGGANGYDCANSLGTRCNIPANNAAFAEGASCASNPVGYHATFCTEDVDPKSCTVSFWSNCYASTPNTCPSIDVICTLDLDSYKKTFQESGAGSPGCGFVTRCE